MINAHTHIFTIEHVPDKFLAPWINAAAKVLLSRRVISGLNKLGMDGPAYLLKKFDNFKKIGELGDQAAVFKHLQGFYPEGTQFVVLSMDMEYMDAGTCPKSFIQQLDTLAELKQQHGDLIHPFVFAHPERPQVLGVVKKYVEEHQFAGIKLYPAIGYFPSDPRLDGVYAYAEASQIPIMANCAGGGVYYQGKLTEERRRDPLTGEVLKKTKNSEFTDYYTDPRQYAPVLEKYPNLKLCFAHYGGSNAWNEFLAQSWHDKLKENWFFLINQYLKDERYPNIYTDVSYTLAEPDLYPILKAYLEDVPAIRERVLFGTDYYMTEQEGSERRFGLNLRGFLGPELWSQIAETNPARYLSRG